MKNVLLAVVLAAASLPVMAQVGVSISVGEPGFYGQLNMGGAPAPQLIYPQPVVIAPAPQFVGVPPIYLHVPPGQAKKWRNYCGRYNACGRPVYFVRDDWYRDRYVPYYREHRGDYDRDRGHGRDRGDWGRGHGHGHEGDQGNGHGRGHGRQDR
ncbi:MAG TPA: hypothetical protein VHK04_02460 [Castellaniella sp.]|nr:hypothetical protein [Castellaniella sp.]